MEAKKLIEADLYRIYGRALKDVPLIERFRIESNPVLFCLKLFRKSSNKLFRYLYTHYSKKYAIEIPYGTKIGAGLYLPHNGRRTINSECIIGTNVTIHPGVTKTKDVVSHTNTEYIEKNIDIDLLELMQDSDIEDAVIDAFKDEATKCSLEMEEMWSYCHDKKTPRMALVGYRS